MDSFVVPFRESLEKLDRLQAEALFAQALKAWSPIEAVERLVVPALVQMGEAWHRGDVALSQVYMSGRFCEALVDKALPPSDPDRKHQPRSAIVVLSDYHDLGKRMVYSVMRASGFELFDYGRLDVNDLIDRAIADRIQVLLISVLILPSALKVRQVIDGLRERGANIRVVVGGAPFSFDAALWQEVGADAMGQNASEAVAIVGRLMGAMP